MSTRTGPVAKAYSRLQAKVFRRTKGRLWKRFLGRPVVLVDVVGQTSGQPRPVMLMRVERGDQFVVCGSNGGNPDVPNWYRNLVAAGEADLEVDGRRHPEPSPRSPTAPSVTSAGTCWSPPTPTSPATKNSPTAAYRSDC